MRILNRLNLPQGIVNACDIEPHNKPGELSATTLLKGVKEIILTQRHWEELEDDVSDRIWAIWGKTAHSFMEAEGENDFSEIDVKKQIGEITLTGRIDNYDMKHGVITDWKTASVYKVQFNDFEDWKKQGLIYAWLLKENGFDVKKCQFIAILKDHSKGKARINTNYPQSPVYIYEFDITHNDLVKIESFIKDQIDDYLFYVKKEDNEILPCTDKERWATKQEWAVMKEGRKSAVRCCDNPIEAQNKVNELGKGHFVEHRQGESRKCLDYCLVKNFCNFYKNLGGEK